MEQLEIQVDMQEHPLNRFDILVEKRIDCQKKLNSWCWTIVMIVGLIGALAWIGSIFLS